MGRRLWLLLLPLLAGCREAAPPAVPPPSQPAPPPDPWQQLQTTVGVLPSSGPGNPAALEQARTALAAWAAQEPGLRVQVALATTLGRLGEGAAPDAASLALLRDELSTARQAVPDDSVYGVHADTAAVIEEAEAALAAGRWALARVELQRAAALATVPLLAAACDDLRRAIETGGQPLAHWQRLAEVRHLVRARGAVGRAQQSAATLALGQARDALDEARAEVLAWAQQDPARLAAVRGLVADLAAAQADLEAAAPGVAERLTALWRKLGREPVVVRGQDVGRTG